MHSLDQHAQDYVEGRTVDVSPSSLFFTEQEIAEAHQDIIDVLNQKPIEFDLGNGQKAIYL